MQHFWKVSLAALVGLATPASSQTNARPVDTINVQWSVITPILDSIRALGDRGLTDSALKLLKSPPKNHPEVSLAAFNRWYAADILRYELVGKRAPLIDAPNWFNMPTGTRTVDLKGKVSIVEFTAHWCGPCGRSYPVLDTLLDRFGNDLQVVRVTQLYGKPFAKGDFVKDELAADKAFYAGKMTHAVPIAVSLQPEAAIALGRYTNGNNADRYGVVSIPHVALIDRNGIVRRVLVGYEKENWEMLTRVVGELINERVAPSAQGSKNVPVAFTGGHDIGANDFGRPIVLMAAALGVKPDEFRQAFSGVTPARGREPTGDEARRNKDALLKVLVPLGVTNERMDEVANYYRFQPQSGNLWPTLPARAHAVVTAGKITGIVVDDPGAGYSSSPTISVSGFAAMRFQVTLKLGKDLTKNGGIEKIDVVK